MMKTCVAFGLMAGLFALSTPAMAQSAKKTDCTYQATVVAAVQQARLNRVRERKVAAHVTAKATWPAKYNAVIPLVTPWVYESPMRDIRQNNLGEAWLELCLQR